MDIKVEGFYTENSEYYQFGLNLRQEIFVDEYGFDKHLEFDGRDKEATHYIVLLDGIPVAYARWIDDGSKIRIDRFGVAKEFRSQGFGLLLVKFVKKEVLPSKKIIELLSVSESVVFFIQQGFKDSNKFDESMKKRLHVLNL